MISFVPTGKTFRWCGRVTGPSALGLVLFAGSIGALYWLNQQTHRELTPCLFKNVTGIPCFLCGGTRATISMAKGEIIPALLFNPLVCAVLVLTAVLFGLKVIFGLKVAIAPQSRRRLWLAAIAAVVVNWIYVVTHLS